MIEFACKRFKTDEIVRCSFGLTRSEFSVLELLMKSPGKEYTTSLASRELGIDLTTSQKAMKKLHERGIIMRRQKNIPSGGYVFTYKCMKKQRIKSMVKEIISNWTSNVNRTIERW